MLKNVLEEGYSIIEIESATVKLMIKGRW